MSHGYFPKGYYDDNGDWQRHVFCHVSCGDQCTCMPPLGVWYSAAHDKRIVQGAATGSEGGPSGGGCASGIETPDVLHVPMAPANTTSKSSGGVQVNQDSLSSKTETTLVQECVVSVPVEEWNRIQRNVTKATDELWANTERFNRLLNALRSVCHSRELGNAKVIAADALQADQNAASQRSADETSGESRQPPIKVDAENTFLQLTNNSGAPLTILGNESVTLQPGESWPADETADPSLLEASRRVSAIALGAAGKHAERVVELAAEVATLRDHLAEQNRLLSLHVAEVARLQERSAQETDGLSKILRVGEDLAKAADAYRVARHELEKAEEIGATDMQGLHDGVADCWRNLGRAIHEFRKQSKRVSG